MNLKKQINSNEKGITLISLVITVVLLLILASVLLMSFDEDEIINATEDSIVGYKDDREAVANTVDGMTTKLDENGMISTAKMEQIKDKIRNSASIDDLEISYTPELVKNEDNTALQIVVPAIYNGGVPNQTFTQNNLGARGENKIKWYIFSANEKGLNLVSEQTLEKITFWDSSGYDNCLYYLDQLSKKLFLNTEDYGVTENRVHAFKLSDIQKATEWYNGSVYNWNIRFEYGAPVKGDYYETAVQSANKYWPGLFEKYLSNGNMTILDGPESEKVGSLITDDSGIERQVYGNPANTLTATGRFYEYDGADADACRTQQFNHLCNNDGDVDGYGRTSIVQDEIFDENGSGYWLASRCIKGGNIHTHFYLRRISTGLLDHSGLCYSSGYNSGNNTPEESRFRVVVSIPPEHVDIDREGNITLK